jgi:D-alanyl-lipoteichoic acid acyltransferase DltB (MBOAT superfamily)
MDTASFQFVLFGLAVALVSNLNRSRAWRSAILLIASLVFLALFAHQPLLFLPLAAFLLLGYLGIMLLERGWSRATVWCILAVILAYVWLKKYTFIPAGTFLHVPYFTLGLSYIFFRVLHLLIESGDQGEKEHLPLGAYLLYTLNFTTLVSGPIQRYDDFARDQFAVEPIALGLRVIGLQLERIVRGFFKVNVLALVLHDIQQVALAQLAQPVSASSKLFAAFELVIVYPFFLYANFSGYIDIVIALARLMRLRLPENFDRPFSASSFIDFWNRWHITLSTWLKTYVYNPLLMALMRRTSSLALQPYLGVFCFFVTFFLVGVWHGRTSGFMVFGVLQGAGVAINKLWQLQLTRILSRKGYKALAANQAYIAFARGLNFLWFAFTLFWFWADWSRIDSIFKALPAAQWCGVMLAVWLAATVVLASWEWLRAQLLSIRTAEGPVLLSRYARVVYVSALGLTAVAVAVLLNQPAPDIVYKAF